MLVRYFGTICREVFMLSNTKTSLKVVAAILISAFANNSLLAQTSDPDVIQHMNWCAGDWGHNIGAQDAVNIVNGLVVAGYPNPVSGYVGVINMISPQIAANTFKRPTFIDAARAIVWAHPETAVTLALTCQSHNRPVKGLLESKKGEVEKWLKGGSVSTPTRDDLNCGPATPVPCVR